MGTLIYIQLGGLVLAVLFAAAVFLRDVRRARAQRAEARAYGEACDDSVHGDVPRVPVGLVRAPAHAREELAA